MIYLLEVICSLTTIIFYLNINILIVYLWTIKLIIMIISLLLHNYLRDKIIIQNWIIIILILLHDLYYYFLTIFYIDEYFIF